jgi:rubrerythrin
MTTKEALKFAIQNEIKSQNLYRILSDTSKNEEAKETFNNLVPIEKIHEEKLIDIYVKKFGSKPEGLDYKAVHQVRKDFIETPAEILKFAITLEEEASKMYSEMAENSENPEAKEVFKQLAIEESQHNELIDLQIENLNGIAIWFDAAELSGHFED